MKIMRTIGYEDWPQHQPEPEGQQQINIKAHFGTLFLGTLLASVVSLHDCLETAVHNKIQPPARSLDVTLASPETIPNNGERHDHQQRT
jgi:hypothetical protein